MVAECLKCRIAVVNTGIVKNVHGVTIFSDHRRTEVEVKFQRKGDIVPQLK